MMQQFMSCMDDLKQNNSNITKMLLEKVTCNYKLVTIDHNFIINVIAVEKNNYLHEMVKSMANTGFENEYSDLYINMHK